MVDAYTYHSVCLEDQIARLKVNRVKALAAGRLEDAAELTRQLDELYAELGSERISRPAVGQGGQR